MTKRSLKKILVSSVSALCAGSLLTTAGFAAPVMSYSILNSSRNVENNTITSNVTAYFKDTIASGSVYAAIYNSDGTLKSVESYPVANANNKTFQLTVPKDKASYNASFFLWDGTTLAPLAGKKALAESDKPSYDVPNFNQDIYGARFAFEGDTLSDKVGYVADYLKDYYTYSVTNENSYTGNESLKINLAKQLNAGNSVVNMKIGAVPKTAKKLKLTFKIKLPYTADAKKVYAKESTAYNAQFIPAGATSGTVTLDKSNNDWFGYTGYLNIDTVSEKDLDLRIYANSVVPANAAVYVDDIVLRALDADGKEIAGYGYDDQNPKYPEKMTEDGTYKVHYSLENGLPSSAGGFEFVNLNGAISGEYSYDGEKSLKATVTNKSVFQIKLNQLAKNINATEDGKKPTKIKISLKLKGAAADRTQFCVEGYMPYASSTIAGYNNIKHTGGQATFITNDTNWHTYTAEWDISDVDFTTRAKTAAGDDRTSEPWLTFKMTDSEERTLYIDDIRIETGAAGTLYDDNIVTE